jgi:hypothetical protein
MEATLSEARKRLRWWVARFDVLRRLEEPAMTHDSSIRRLPTRTLRQHPDLSALVARTGGQAYDVLAYEAVAEDAYGRVRLAALFPEPLDAGGEPLVFALDGDRRSLHRNPPFDDGIQGCSGHLCLYYSRDPEERRWTPEYGLLELFDLARRHLLAEHVWRQTGRWPIDEAEHGMGPAARRRPHLRIKPLREEVTANEGPTVPEP